MRHYSSESDLRSKISETVKEVSTIVTSTLGPEGKTVLLRNKENNPFVTKDGVTVSRFIKFEDPIKDAIAQTIRQAAEETNTKCGDGTTTTTLLVEAIYSEALKYIQTGISPYILKKGIDMAVSDVLFYLDKASTPIKSLDDIRNIAMISANNDVSIGDLLADAIDQIGKDGSITIEEARSLQTSLSIVEGYKFDGGYASPEFITHPSTALCKLEDCYVLISEQPIETQKQIGPIAEMVAREGKSLVMIAEDFSKEILAWAILNSVRKSLKNVCVKSPKYGEERKMLLNDLAIATGATYIDRLSGLQLQDIKLEHLGRCKSIEVSKLRTTISDPKGNIDKINERIEMLKSMRSMETNDAEIMRLQERITRLSSGVAIIKVGGATEAEVTEKRHRIEDALNAVRTAIDSGISVGGGISFLQSINAIGIRDIGSDEHYGIEIIKKALVKPVMKMSENASMSGEYIIGKVKEIHLTGLNDYGYDFANKEYCDLKVKGIIDPTLVLKLSLQNACSAAMVLLMSNHAIVEV